jgi:hypothetical protein
MIARRDLFTPGSLPRPHHKSGDVDAPLSANSLRLRGSLGLRHRRLRLRSLG